MSKYERPTNAEDAPGILRSFKAVVTTLTAVLHTRLELLTTELEEERERLKQTLLLALLAFFGLSLGIILLTLFAVAVFWQAGWIHAVGALAILYLGVGFTAGVRLRRKVLGRAPLFTATLAELAKDRDHLRSALRD